MAKIGVIGLWHLGCVVSACLAEAGNEVTGGDFDQEILSGLKKGKPPLFEPGIEDLIGKNLAEGRLQYTDEFSEIIPGREFIFITFDTPVDEQDRSDLTVIERAIDEIARYADREMVIVISSQLPVGTSRRLQEILKKKNKNRLEIVYSPENLRLGDAIKTFREPDRIVIGADSVWAGDRLERLYGFVSSPKLRMDLNSAEMTKHALNSFLAASVSFINEIADLTEIGGADIRQVVHAMKTDRRIGPNAFLNPGMGFAGGTLARDIQVLRELGRKDRRPTRILDAVLLVNQERIQDIKEKVSQRYPKLEKIQLGLLGLTYKPKTSTLRRSMALALAREFLKEGAWVQAFDPMIQEAAPETEGIRICRTPYEAAEGAHALILATEWPEFREIDFVQVKQRMKEPFLMDTRNFLNPELMASLGFKYQGIGVER